MNRSAPYIICKTYAALRFTRLLCHGPSVTSDNITSDSYPVYLVGKIRRSNKGVWSEIILRMAKKVLGTSAILPAGQLFFQVDSLDTGQS